MIETAPKLDPVVSATRLGPCILGVAGGTGSGKTTVARAILEAVGADRITLIEQDSYYRDVDWRSEAELLHHNFDHPAALDNELLVSHLAALKAGHPIEVPIYDFVRHRRTPRTRRVMPSKPLWASITSTMVMAPIRKNTIRAVAVTDSLNCSLTTLASCRCNA